MSLDLIANSLRSVQFWVDIILMWVAIYYLLIYFTGPRANRTLQPVFWGIIVFFVILFLASWLKLSATEVVLKSLLQIVLIFFAILFAPEIRRIFIEIGRGAYQLPMLWVGNPEDQRAQSLPSILRAVLALKKRKYGALIAITLSSETRVEMVSEGEKIDSLATENLISSIFNPASPLHDGAIIIVSNRIERAGVVFPLSKNPQLMAILGTRHRAAVGISETSDVVCLVVSEENANISLAYRGRLVYNLSTHQLQEHLDLLLMPNKAKADYLPMFGAQR